VRADLVTINGQEERRPEKAYYLEWWEGAKRVRLSVGKDAGDASARRLQKEAELNALNHAVAVALPFCVGARPHGRNPNHTNCQATPIVSKLDSVRAVAPAL